MVFFHVSASASSLRLVCSYDSKARDRVDGAKVTVSDIDPNLCTHLIYASAGIDQGYRLAPKYTNEEKNYQAFNTLKTRNPKLKTLLSVGDLDLQKFSEMMSTQPRRARFIRSAIIGLRNNGFDGLNLIWRYTGGAGSHQQEKQRFTLLCKELKEAFVGEVKQTGRDRLIVTASVPAEKATIDASYEVAQIAMYLDFINVLTFYFHGPKETVTRHNSPLFKGSKDTGDHIYLNADYAMRYWRDLGAPAQKLNLGLAAFGETFELSSVSNGVGAPVKGPGEGGSYTSTAGFLAYYEV
ncbi:chitotriosidase-1-like [Sebastes fasciatus]|uniref:chitotriosidase-1-like n=1 Tax=Sebastes fasciatus TaxID=394691 RepID=UPI003D9F797B